MKLARTINIAFDIHLNACDICGVTQEIPSFKHTSPDATVGELHAFLLQNSSKRLASYDVPKGFKVLYTKRDVGVLLCLHCYALMESEVDNTLERLRSGNARVADAVVKTPEVKPEVVSALAARGFPVK